MQDGDFQEERFRNIVNAYLANTLGNLVNRCLGLLKKNCDSTFPADAASLDEEHPLRTATAAEVGKDCLHAHGELAADCMKVSWSLLLPSGPCLPLRCLCGCCAPL